MPSQQWYFARDNQQQGPVSEDALRDMLKSNQLSGDALIWSAGMADWQPARKVPEFEEIFIEVTLRPTEKSPPTLEHADPYQGSAGAEFEELPVFNGYAGFWKRVVAAIIDGFILGFMGLVAGIILGVFAAASGATHQGTELMANIVGIAISWLYHAFMESSARQATLGKMAMGIVVTDLHGQQVSFGRASGRFFGMYLSAFLLLIGFIMVAFTKRKQGLHDILAGCLVVNK